MEKFQLLNGETLVVSFTHDRTLIGDTYSDIVVHELSRLPIRLKNECSEALLRDWINQRSVPVNRHHMEAMLGALNLEKPFDIMRYSHALSLNDTFWMKEEDKQLTFAEINLYDNKFDEALGWIAFTGLPSDISRNLSTPELTTAGMLPKFWQRIGFKDVVLVKGGTSGYSNAGYEPYNEVAAHLAAKKLDIETIPYHLQKVKGKIASVSSLFTSKETGLITGNEYLSYKYPNVSTKTLGDLFVALKADKIDTKPFYEMCYLDYIIENFDRHLSNWGLSVDNHSQTLKGIAPIWDNGISLDHGKPLDMRGKFDFASFGIKYDFVKDCDYTKEFQSRTNKLMISIKSGELAEEIYTATRAYYPDPELSKKTSAFIESRCLEFLKPLNLSVSLHNPLANRRTQSITSNQTSNQTPAATHKKQTPNHPEEDEGGFLFHNNSTTQNQRRNNTINQKEQAIPNPKQQPIYKHSYNTALQKGETDAFNASRILNEECAKAIDHSIEASSYDIYRYDLRAAAENVVKEYGVDRVAWVVASTLNASSDIGRVTWQTKEWANTFNTPKPDDYLKLKTHPTMLDGFVRHLREQMSAAENNIEGKSTVENSIEKENVSKKDDAEKNITEKGTAENLKPQPKEGNKLNEQNHVSNQTPNNQVPTQDQAPSAIPAQTQTSSLSQTPTPPNFNITAYLNPLHDQSNKVKAMASISIDGVVAINNLTLVEGKNGMFVGYPSKKTNDGEYQDHVEFARDADGKFTKNAVDLKEAIRNTLIHMYKNDIRKIEAPANAEPVDHSVDAIVHLVRNEESKIKAMSTVQVGDILRINGVKVVEGAGDKAVEGVNGNVAEGAGDKDKTADKAAEGKSAAIAAAAVKPFVAMPSTTAITPDGKTVYPEVVHPINKEFREKIINKVMEKFEDRLAWKQHAQNKAQVQTQTQGINQLQHGASQGQAVAAMTSKPSRSNHDIG